MNTKNNITPLADLISRVDRWHKITGIQAGTQGLDRDINELKSKAKAEHAALVAVAEAAKEFDMAVAAVVKNQNHLPGEISRNYISAGLNLRSAIANLEAVRGESEGGK